MPDAIVVGAGPNGLTAANQLVDAGWDVLVLEAQDQPGGAVRSGEPIRPGTRHDLFSAFYPLTAASPPMRRLNLERHGLRWRHAPLAVAHPLPDGRCAYVHSDPDQTAESLESFHPGDGEAWRRLYARWETVSEPLLDALFTPFPPVLPSFKLARRVGVSDLARFLRFLALPVRRMGQETFAGDGGRLLLTGNSLHADFLPESIGSGFFGWLLASLAQQVGFPVPEGGAQSLTDALVSRFQAGGGRLVCGQRVSQIIVRNGRAIGVATDDGHRIRARRAVLADVAAPNLYLDLVGPEHLPDALLGDLARFQIDNATFKIDWILNAPVPWAAEPARDAGTIHLGASMADFTRAAAQLAMGLIPARPFLVMGQMDAADPTRSPEGAWTLWAYTKVPQDPRGDAAGELTGSWTAEQTRRFVDRVETEIERHAPGFRDLIDGRYVQRPADLQEANENLIGGAVNAGTAQMHQQLIFRPTPGLGRAETPIAALYLASASAHPGGGVHGGPGANAARAAQLGSLSRSVLVAASRALSGGPVRRTAQPTDPGVNDREHEQEAAGTQAPTGTPEGVVDDT